MPVYVDLECDKCGGILEDQWSSLVDSTHACGGKLIRLYTVTRGPTPGGHSSEKVVVYQSAQEGGKIQYPGRNDVPIPERLRKRGYERVEISPAQLGSFERKHGVMNERRHYDRNGRGI